MSNWDVNFLSHYYFERHSPCPERILGVLLPDLLKNADKRYVFHPRRHEAQLFADPKTRRISEGWYRHVEVDRAFHNSPFFLAHCRALRKELAPLLEHLPVRPSFMAHIAIELLLDQLLMRDGMADPAALYEQLDRADRTAVRKYLTVLGSVDVDLFLQFYEKFVASRYILEYAVDSNIARALFGICWRVWDFSLRDEDCENLAERLAGFRDGHLRNYREEFFKSP